MRFPERHAVENLWRNRLHDAQRRLDSAHNRVDALQRASLKPLSDDPDYQSAVRAENIVLEEYLRVLHIFAELVLRGKIPDERDSPVGGAGWLAHN